MEGKNETQKKIEIRTMAKDIARLREKETDKQRDKIVAIKADQTTQQINDARNFNVRPKLPQFGFQRQKQENKGGETSRQEMENRENQIVQEENFRGQEGQEKTRLAELLNRAKGSMDRIRERTELRKTEKALSEQRPDSEEKFFKKPFGEEKMGSTVPSETQQSPEIQQIEKTPEQIMIERLQKVEEQRESEKKERENFLQRVTEEKIQIEPESIQIGSSTDKFSLMSKTSLKKIPISEKIWVRILVVGVLITVWGILITFNYWANVARKPVPEQITPAPPIQTQTPVYSQSFIPVKETIFLRFNTTAELKNALAQYLKNPYSEGETRRIVFGDNATKQILTTQQLFQSLGINVPPSLGEKVNKDFTFFIYSKEAYNRFGIIMKIDNRENLPTLLTGWEPSIEQDLDILFSMVGKKAPAIVPYFRSGKYSGYNYRFQTFAINDLGACYSTVGNYFVLTSSMESLNRVVDQLK